MDYLDYQGLQRYHELLSDQIGAKASKVKIGSSGTEYSSSNGTITIPLYPTTLPASDVQPWAKAASKPTYAYSEIGYEIQSTSSVGGAITIDGSKPLHIITLTGNVSGVTLSTNPSSGHYTHVIFTAANEQTIAIAHNSNTICPEGEDLELTIPAGGYVEVSFLNINNIIYVRGL